MTTGQVTPQYNACPVHTADTIKRTLCDSKDSVNHCNPLISIHTGAYISAGLVRHSAYTRCRTRVLMLATPSDCIPYHAFWQTQ